MKRNLFAVIIFLSTFPIALLAQYPATTEDIPPFVQKEVRTPQFPLKKNRMLYSAADVTIALNNIRQYKEAATIKDKIVEEAGFWLQWSDEDIRSLLTDARVPRGFDLNPHGCPQHGDTIFKVGGTYPWIVDPRNMFKVKCPVGGEIYPSNDYKAFYESNFKDKKDWDGPYTDAGWGWIAPDGERYWFVAYANHWTWLNWVQPGVVNLARAYLLTGEKKYAHKAAVMLHRLAEVYPSMNHADQSRYGYILKKQGGIYNGKIVNLIWETFFIQNVAEAYDAVWETIDTDLSLQLLTSKTGEQLRAFIEANVLEDALDAYLELKIQGNYGMHQAALLYVLLARQFMDTEKYIDKIVDEPGVSRVQTGIRYALYNMIFRDGTPLESPSYNILTVDKLTSLSDLLKKAGRDLFREPRLRLLLESPLQMVVTKKYTPDIGDSGSSLGGIIGLNSNVYQLGYDAYPEPAFLQWLRFMNRTGKNSFQSYQSLYRHTIKDQDTSAILLPPQQSRLFAGYGMGILNNKKDNTGLSFNYGYKGTHYHWDFLNVELFANGQVMMPDMGYPDAMNEFVKEVYTWSTNTVSHSTVVVNAQKQALNNPGILHHFGEGGFARSMDAGANPYRGVTEYRRNIIMIDADSNRSYFVDWFRVSGGHQHDYVLHGPPGNETVVSGKWSSQRPGTFAGEGVKLADIYDDVKLGDPVYQGSYARYRGSGYQHLFHVQQLESGTPVSEFSHLRDSLARIRYHLLPAKNQQLFKADAYDKPRAKDHVVKYLLLQARARDTAQNIRSVFNSVWEPFAGKPFIKEVKSLAVTGGAGQAVSVWREALQDIVISDTGNAVKRIPLLSIETDAQSAVVTIDARKQLKRVYFIKGSFLKYGRQLFKTKSISGTITAIDIESRTVTVTPADLPKMEGLAFEHQLLYVKNAFRNTEHPISSLEVDSGNLQIKLADDILTGRLTLDSISENKILTKTTLPFGPLYKGSTLVDKKMKPIGIIADITNRDSVLSVIGNLANLRPGEEAWISNIAVGETIKIQLPFSWEAPAGTNK